MLITALLLASASQSDDPMTPAEIAACIEPRATPEYSAADRDISKRVAALSNDPSIPIATPAFDLFRDLSTDFVGQTIVSFTLLPIGRVGDCNILKTSGSASHDALACSLVKARLVLAPAKKDGHPLVSTQKIAIRWIPRLPSAVVTKCRDMGGAIPVSLGEWFPYREFLPLYASERRRQDPNLPISGRVSLGSDPKLKAGAIFFELGISAFGVPVRCQILASTLPKDTQNLVCRMIALRAWLLPAVDDRGFLKPTVVRAVLRIVNG